MIKVKRPVNCFFRSTLGHTEPLRENAKAINPINKGFVLFFTPGHPDKQKYSFHPLLTDLSVRFANIKIVQDPAVS